MKSNRPSPDGGRSWRSPWRSIPNLVEQARKIGIVLDLDEAGSAH
jgi:hypothetical protein